MEKDDINNVLPALQQTDVIGSLPFVRFASDNNYRYVQDFGFWRGIPSDVPFYPIDELPNGLIGFIADGHGMQAKYGIAGKYGNGSIHVYKDDIPHLVEWCRANFL